MYNVQKYVAVILAIALLMGIVLYRQFNSASAATFPFIDGFESNNFTVGGWTNNGCVTQNTYRNTGSYAARFDRYTSLTKNISTVGYSDITIKYARMASGFMGADYLRCEWYDGTTWTVLEDFYGYSGTWTGKTWVLPVNAGDNASFSLRFSVPSGGNKRYAYLDDVEISGTPLPLGYQNLVSGKVATGSVGITNAAAITDGTISTSNYANLASGAVWIQYDLGTVYSVDRIKLWHYFGDSRRYRDVILQLSNTADFSSGVITVFNNDADNSAGQGIGSDAEYAESSSGKLVAFSAVNARYVRLWSNGNTVNVWNHYIEVEVYGAPPPTPMPTPTPTPIPTPTPVPTSTPVAIFYDGFESGGFTTGGWVNNGSTVSSAYRNAGTYSASLTRYNTLTKSISTAGYTDIVVKYAGIAPSFTSTDYFRCEWYNGTTWTILEDSYGYSGSWSVKTWVLPTNAYNNPSFRIRFSIPSTGNKRYAYLDDVQITGIPLPPTPTPAPTPTPTPTPVPTPTPTPITPLPTPTPKSIFYEGFESGGYLSGGWTNSGAAVNTTNRYTGTYSSQFNLTDRITKSLSTKGYKDIQIKYVRTTVNYETNDYFICEWYNGTGWYALETISGNNAWEAKTWSLPSSANNNAAFQFRFRTQSDSSLDYAYLDNVEVIGTEIKPFAVYSHKVLTPDGNRFIFGDYVPLQIHIQALESISDPVIDIDLNIKKSDETDSGFNMEKLRDTDGSVDLGRIQVFKNNDFNAQLSKTVIDETGRLKIKIPVQLLAGNELLIRYIVKLSANDSVLNYGIPKYLNDNGLENTNIALHFQLSQWTFNGIVETTPYSKSSTTVSNLEKPNFSANIIVEDSNVLN
ncbi:MAG: hypothetical protein N3B21_00130 [Clostridia bacterium]|nr:hypothetical protein [Clostridia bacterium]